MRVGVCPIGLIGEGKEKNSKKEEGTEDTRQMQSWRGGKIMEASDGYVFGKREKQRKFY